MISGVTFAANMLRRMQRAAPFWRGRRDLLRKRQRRNEPKPGDTEWLAACAVAFRIAMVGPLLAIRPQKRSVPYRPLKL